MIILSDEEFQQLSGISAFNDLMQETLNILHISHTTKYSSKKFDPSSLSIKVLIGLSHPYIIIYETQPAITTSRAHSGYAVLAIENIELPQLINQIKRIQQLTLLL